MARSKTKKREKPARDVTFLQRARARQVETLIALAAEPIPPGNGLTFHGSGDHRYVKVSDLDGSMRCFDFERLEDMERAMEAGIAADLADAELAA